MKKNSRQKLTPLQQNRLLRISALLAVTALLWLLLAPGSGLLALWRQRTELASLEVQTEQLRQQNEQLRQEIEKLRSDPAYLEEVARRDYGLLKEHERVYDFSKPQQNNE